MLFLKECKKVLLSFTFIIYCIITGLVFKTQYYDEHNEKILRPSEYQSNYGVRTVENQELTMNNAISSLISEYAVNKYVCYPFGFYKAIKLKEKDRQRVDEFLQELTGLTHDEIEKTINESEVYWTLEGEKIYNITDICISEKLTYERFTEIMGDADDVLGGGSWYSPDDLVENFSNVPETYEEANAEYEKFVSEDAITGGLSRLFCDYLGIDLSFLPVFAAAALTSYDRKNKINSVIYSKKISSLKLVLTRFAAITATLYIPVLIFSLIAVKQALSVYGEDITDISVMLTLPLFWLLPSIMISTASGMLITELSLPGIAIAVQGVWAFYSLNTTDLSGDIGRFSLVCRHNTPFGREIFLEQMDSFVFNRIFYMILALVIVIAASLVYNLKRGGKLGEIRMPFENYLIRHKA